MRIYLLTYLLTDFIWQTRILVNVELMVKAQIRLYNVYNGYMITQLVVLQRQPDQSSTVSFKGTLILCP